MLAKLCPICGSPHDTYGAVAMHMVKMEDEFHEGVDTKDEGLEHLVYTGILMGADRIDCDTEKPADSKLGYV